MKLALAIAFSVLLVSSNDSFSADEKYVFPKDKEVPVLTLASSGGFRIRQPVKPEPLVSIYADGRVVAGKTNPNVASSEWKMTPKQLKTLLDFCVKKNDLLSHTSAAIKAAIDGTGKRVMIADAPNTDIAININGKNHKVSVYALFFVARQFGKVESIKQVSAIEKELKRFHTLAVLGGPKELAKLLKLANEEMAAKDKQAPKFTAKNVTYAQKTVNGKTQMSMSHNEKDAKGLTTASFSVQVALEEGEEPLVTPRVYRRKKK
jgi:hypothetical protein